MKQKISLIKFNKYTIGSSIFIAIAAISTVVILPHNHTEAASPAKPAVGAAVPSQFKFTGANGWWQGATNKTSMALFHKTDGCFTSVEHKSGMVDTAAELQKQYDMQTRGGYTVTPGNTQTLTIQTVAGQEKYDLHQSSVTGTGDGGKVKGGQEFGYVQLPSGYIKVMGYCDTPDQLPATLPALQAIKFDSTK